MAAATVKRRDRVGDRPGNGPTEERERHGKVTATASIPTEDAPALPGVRMHRVQSPIERYAARGSLTKRQVEAASDLRSDWEFGILLAHNSYRAQYSVVSSNGGTSAAGYTDAQLDAATTYRTAVQAMGKSIAAIVLPVVIGDAAGGEITVEMLAARRSHDDPDRRSEDRKQVMGMLKLGLDTLADHYASCPDRRRSAKYA